MLKISRYHKSTILYLGEIDLEGNYVISDPPYPEDNIILFSNNDFEDDRKRIKLFDYIKDIEVSEIPEDVQFRIMQIRLADPLPAPLEKVPFPFDCVTVGNDNKDSFFVRFSTFTDRESTEKWENKWASDFYFNGLKEIELDEGIVIFSYDRKDFPQIYVQINLLKTGSIGYSIDSAISKLEFVLKKVEVKLSGLEDLFNAVDIWHKNIENKSEKFWQNILLKYSWILSHSFNSPLILFEKEAFLGGKSLPNTKGRIVDFILQNKLTQNIALIEIKTPKTRIIGKKYRNVYTICEEITGAISQLLDYKEQLLKNYYSIKANTDSAFTVFNPKLLLIAGSFKSLTSDEKNTFELFRSELKSVEVITFDELFEKIFMLIELIDANTEHKTNYTPLLD